MDRQIEILTTPLVPRALEICPSPSTFIWRALPPSPNPTPFLEGPPASSVKSFAYTPCVAAILSSRVSKRNVWLRADFVVVPAASRMLLTVDSEEEKPTEKLINVPNGRSWAQACDMPYHRFIRNFMSASTRHTSLAITPLLIRVSGVSERKSLPATLLSHPSAPLYSSHTSSNPFLGHMPRTPQMTSFQG